MYEIQYSTKSKKFLKNLNKNIIKRILNRIERLRENPIPSDSKFIGRENNEKIFRYRIGDYRALYKIKESQKVVLITKIDKRSKIYN